MLDQAAKGILAIRLEGGDINYLNFQNLKKFLIENSMANNICEGDYWKLHILNSCNQTGKNRVVSLSKDGGETWDTTFIDHNLPDPICEGSLLNIGAKRSKFTLPSLQFWDMIVVEYE